MSVVKSSLWMLASVFMFAACGGGELPVISSFAASPASTSPGDASTLSWTVTSAEALRLDPGAVVVTGTTSLQVNPTATTAYTLTATNAKGSATASVTVTVAAVVSAIAAGDAHTLALKSDGTVWSWGWNRDGQLGDGANTDRYSPARVGSLSGASAIAAGGDHSVALEADGTVWTWGNNLQGQLGDGTYTNRNTPAVVPGLTGVTAVAAGHSFTMALKGDGTVWIWGDNFGGLVGNWPDYPAGKWPTPVQVAGLTNVFSIAAGWEHAMVLRYPQTTGEVWTWGDGDFGQLGGGTLNTSSMRYDPQLVVSGAAAVTAGAGADHNRHSLVIKQNGTLWAFGYNAHGELGDGTTTARTTPVQVSGVTSPMNAAAGSTFSVLVQTDGSVWSWGANVNGQLGDGTIVERHAPAQVPGLSGAFVVVAGGDHALVIKQDHTVWGWGGNGNGELGDGTTTERHAPVQVLGL